MSATHFYTRLAALLLLQSMGLWWWYAGNVEAAGKGLAISGMVFFGLLNVVFFHLATYLSARSLDKAYLNMTWLNFLMKVLVALGLPAYYYFQYHLSGAAFIVPFLIIYVCFTVFETWVLHSLAVVRRA